MTARADTAEVLANWGPTAREIQAQVAAAKAAEEKAKAEASAKAARPPAQRCAVQGGHRLSSQRPTPPASVADLPKAPSVIIGAPGAGTAFPSARPL